MASTNALHQVEETLRRTTTLKRNLLILIVVVVQCMGVYGIRGARTVRSSVSAQCGVTLFALALAEIIWRRDQRQLKPKSALAGPARYEFKP